MKLKRFLGCILCILVLINLRFCVTLKYITLQKLTDENLKREMEEIESVSEIRSSDGFRPK